MERHVEGCGLAQMPHRRAVSMVLAGLVVAAVGAGYWVLNREGTEVAPEVATASPQGSRGDAASVAAVPPKPEPTLTDRLLEVLPKPPRLPGLRELRSKARIALRNVKRKVYIATVRNETIEESIDAVMEEGLSELFISSSAREMDGVAFEEYVSEASKDPRLRRLLQIAREGSPDERRRLREYVAGVYESKLERERRDGALFSAFSTRGMVMTMLLAESADDGTTAMPLILAAFDSSQVQLRTPGLPPKPWGGQKYVYTEDVLLQNHCLRWILDHVCDDPDLHARLSPERLRVIDEFRACRDSSTKYTDGEGHPYIGFYTLIRFARAFVSDGLPEREVKG